MSLPLQLFQCRALFCEFGSPFSLSPSGGGLLDACRHVSFLHLPFGAGIPLGVESQNPGRVAGCICCRYVPLYLPCCYGFCSQRQVCSSNLATFQMAADRLIPPPVSCYAFIAQQGRLQVYPMACFSAPPRPLP